MNSKKYDVTEKSSPISLKKTIKNRVNSGASPGKMSPTIQFYPNGETGSPNVTIMSSITTNNPDERKLSQSSLNTNGSNRGSSDDLLKAPDFQRNLSDNSNGKKSPNKQSNYQANLFRNLSDDQEYKLYCKPTPTYSSGISSSIRKIFKKDKNTDQILISSESNKIKKCDETNGKKNSNASKFYLDNDSNGFLTGAMVIKPFTQGKMNHSVSMILDSDHIKEVEIQMDPIKTLKSSSSKNDIKAKLNFLTSEERVEIQQKGLTLMKERLQLKKDLRNNLKTDIDELNSELVNQNVRIRSVLEIEKLRGEIRKLTNEKAILELKYSQQLNWICNQCTYSNTFDCFSCKMCEKEREDDELLICEHCHQKNPLSTLSCLRCNAYFNVEPGPSVIDERRNSSTSNVTNLNRIISNSGSTSSLNSNHSVMPVQPSIPFIPSKRH